MKFTRQFDQMDCGPACVRMVASHFGRDYPLSYLRSLCHLTREGVSVAGIRDALGHIGIDSASFEMTMAQLEESCPMPCILYWEQNHFVVLEKINHRGKFVIANPAYGRCNITRRELEYRWLNGTKGVVIAVEPTEEFHNHPDVSHNHSLKAFARQYIWPYRWQLIQSMLAMFVGMLMGLVTPFLTQAVVDEGIATRNMGLIIDILLAQLALFAGSFTMNLIGSWVALYMSTHINIGILGDYIGKLMKLPISFFDTKSQGDYQQRFGDHSRLQAFMTGSTISTLFSLLSVPFYLGIIAIYSPAVMVAFLLFTILSALWMSYFFRRRKVMDYERFRLSVENQNQLYEMMGGIIDIKINAYTEHKLAKWQELQHRQYAIGCRSLKLNQIQATGSTVISQLRDILIICWIAGSVVNGDLTLGMMMSISAIIGMVGAPLAQLTDFLQQYQDAKISLERSQEVHLCEPEDNSDKQSVDSAVPEDIELRGVTFSYSGSIGVPVLSDINLTIPAGKMTAIVGESGSGKTTLLKLILKFYPPDSGQILLGGKPFDTLSAESIRSAAGIVMQDNFLFSDTIAHNIVMGENIDADRLQNAIQSACLDDLITRSPLGYEMKVGANGVGVSGGEKQRIMIARAIYKRPAYLMMDEATSSLDAENEATITSNIESLFAGRTRIVIAHRLSTVCNADNIIVLRHGRVVESGTHDDLVKRRGYYFELIQKQLEIAE